MIQGTGSSAGKSLLVTALCRIFKQDGYRVAPFKAQNMGSSSFVTPQGLEIARAQAIQAGACGLKPEVRMNPVLLKPVAGGRTAVVVAGKRYGTMGAIEYYARKEELRTLVEDSYHSLAREFDCMVLEGAGSPAEINLRDGDFVNMGLAALAGAPVLLVGDIDRGGVFAALAGTMLLLEEEEKQRVRGMVINKFRGERALLEPGLEELERITGVPVLGVIPWLQVGGDGDWDEAAYDRLAAAVRVSLDLELLYAITGLTGTAGPGGSASFVAPTAPTDPTALARQDG